MTFTLIQGLIANLQILEQIEGEIHFLIELQLSRSQRYVCVSLWRFSSLILFFILIFETRSQINRIGKLWCPDNVL